MARAEILIVGINSFLGKAVYELTKAEYSVIGVFNRNKENIPADVNAVPVESIAVLSGRSFSHIYLISSCVPDGTGMLGDDEKLMKANILLPGVICKLFPEARIIFCSSVAVYENVNITADISINEAPVPQSKYALSKLWGERIIENHASYAIIRISSMYGAGMKSTTFIPRIIENAILKGEIALQGDGGRLQNYIHVEDVASIAVKAGNSSKNITILAVNDNSYTNRSIAEMILENIPGNLTFWGQDNSRSKRYDNAETHNLLGKIEFKSIRTGLRELVEWSKKKF